LNQSCYQVSITLTGYFAFKKKSCLYPYGCCHPENFPLDLHSQLIALNLSQITLFFHKMMMHLFGLSLRPRFCQSDTVRSSRESAATALPVLRACYLEKKIARDYFTFLSERIILGESIF
jgi:hypothetical protein